VAYDPTLTSIIVVAVVGGTAAVLNASAEWELEHELSRATDRWTRLEVVRTYSASAARDLAAREEAMLAGHGYVAVADDRSRPVDGAGAATAAGAGARTVCYRRARTA
jgi:hypothetical protein